MRDWYKSNICSHSLSILKIPSQCLHSKGCSWCSILILLVQFSVGAAARGGDKHAPFVTRSKTLHQFSMAFILRLTHWSCHLRTIVITRNISEQPTSIRTNAPGAVCSYTFHVGWSSKDIWKLNNTFTQVYDTGTIHFCTTVTCNKMIAVCIIIV